ncbi:hypothetical protein EWB00_000120 [Schistosoma japonicum]|uniref:Uncharacterized protein n=1 Tax=Schistosoma japonicum TaxID=6182 RepID=A0A4Z2CKI0_SCHJA|nr:hypothetical protein EWB00_000120 [Schistosoma japonicum]
MASGDGGGLGRKIQRRLARLQATLTTGLRGPESSSPRTVGSVRLEASREAIVEQCPGPHPGLPRATGQERSAPQQELPPIRTSGAADQELWQEEVTAGGDRDTRILADGALPTLDKLLGHLLTRR